VKFFLLLALLAGSAFAGPTEKQIMGAWAVAYGQYHGLRSVYDEGPPSVQLESKVELCARMNQPHTCHVRGVYEDGVIYMDAALNFETIEAMAMLVHEDVHHLQHKNKGSVNDLPEAERCEAYIARERQAYLIQANVLSRSGAGLAAMMVLHIANAQTCQ